MNGFNGFESTSRNRGKTVQIPSFFEEDMYVYKIYIYVCVCVCVEIYTPTYVSPNMHMTCLLLAQDTQVKIVCVSDLLVIIVQSGSGALAPVTGFLGK